MDSSIKNFFVFARGVGQMGQDKITAIWGIGKGLDVEKRTELGKRVQ